jgi:hypothetical protein
MVIKAKMHAKTLFSFCVWKTQYDFLALRHLVICTQKIFVFSIFFCIFGSFSWKPGILIPDSYEKKTDRD